MYGYNIYRPLTEEGILNRVSEEEIFQIFIKKPIKLDKEELYVAPYRNDSNPGCWFEYYEGQLQFVDFGIPEPIKKNNCFWFISKCTGLSYLESLEYINLYFGLSNEGDLSFMKEEVKPKVTYVPKERDKRIYYIKRLFTPEDKEFWGSYEISRSNLEEDKVFAIKLYRFQSKKGVTITVTPFDIAYAFTEFEGGRVKIYRPKADKKSKWLTNCGPDDIGSINHLPLFGDILVISKSYKDCRVLRNQGVNSIWFQSESMFPNPELIKQLCKRFDRIFVLWDNDSVGLSTGKMLTQYINSISPNKATHTFLPPKLLLEKIKDPSDLIFSKGRQELLSFLENKKIIV